MADTGQGRLGRPQRHQRQQRQRQWEQLALWRAGLPRKWQRGAYNGPSWCAVHGGRVSATKVSTAQGEGMVHQDQQHYCKVWQRRTACCGRKGKDDTISDTVREGQERSGGSSTNSSSSDCSITGRSGSKKRRREAGTTSGCDFSLCGSGIAISKSTSACTSTSIYSIGSTLLHAYSINSSSCSSSSHF